MLEWCTAHPWMTFIISFVLACGLSEGVINLTKRRG